MVINRRVVLTGALSLPLAARPARSAILPRWQRFAVTAGDPAGRPVISIVIDDMGVIHPGTRRAVALPAPLTLSWFPFARNLPDQVGTATERGHEALLHMPMQASGTSIAWTGPDPLRIDLPAEENLRRLLTAIDSVPDTVGLNNHMGSVATRDPALMALVARETRKRDMLFLDSLTITHSVGYQQAALAGVPAASRDVFIDNAADTAQILAQLERTEQIARRQGHVIAIGHPRPHTLDALEAWLPGLAAKGFMLWPLSATVAWRNEIAFPAG
ncbi:divergent polysaccharide deacetylase family protein [Limobrevibacterium gyesilva]|uniref:Divergent polysaccharide deacetylase family protein n=1 Tax=Limobrevibacterium gyesilva TaxID=2991712 RepID=A0AA41YJ29_9PROT|nr:divergent polysaccharide deacetylase family protein [Limobrevibacterium gyesilva]MCW3474561.1 divergent polysaccharide deacetylase family protein [Limobrevibacterium gyesilva]